MSGGRLRPLQLVMVCVAGLGAGGLVACDGRADAAADAGIRLDTVAGVVHVASGSRGQWEAGREWVVADSGVTIGAVDGPAEYVLGAVAGVVVDDGGRIWVADTQSKEIRVFDRDGAFLRRVGRDGEGPGEFRNLSGLTRAPEGVGALDGTLGRVTVFDTAGAVVRSFRLQRGYMVLEHGAPIAFDAEGRFHDRIRFGGRPGVDSIGVVTYSPAGQPLDTALIAVVEPDHLAVTRNGRPIMTVPRPFSPRPALAFGPDGTVHFSRGGAYRIEVIAPTGDTLRVLRREITPRPVTDEERAEQLDWIDEVFAEAGGRVDRSMELPPTHPPVQGLRVDRDGNVWVLVAVDAGERRMTWSVHDRQGGYLGDVATPLMNVLAIGKDHVAGVTMDALDVPRVTVLPIRR